MSERYRISNLLGGGTFAAHFLPKIREAADHLGVSRSFLTMGRLEFNLAVASEPTDFGRDGVTDVSPTPQELQQAIGHAGSDAIAESNRHLWEPLTHRFVQQTLQAHLRQKLADGQTLWVQGMSTGHRTPAEEALRELKSRLSQQFSIGLSCLPDDAAKRDNLRSGYTMFTRLKDEGVLESTFLVDNSSPFALRFGLDLQDRCVALAIASLFAGQFHMSKNPSLAECSRSLGDYGAYIGMSFASRSLAVDQQVFWWKWLRSAGPELPLRGSADISNVILEACEATNQALTHPDARAIAETVDSRKPLTVIYTVPLPLSQPKLWATFASEVRRWLARSYPTASPVFASGNGVPDPRYLGSYHVQVSALFPMPDVPAPIQQILESPSLLRRFRGGESANGNHPAADLTPTRPLFQGR